MELRRISVFLCRIGWLLHILATRLDMGSISMAPMITRSHTVGFFFLWGPSQVLDAWGRSDTKNGLFCWSACYLYFEEHRAGAICSFIHSMERICLPRYARWTL
ncbi:hypothetical protein TNCV_1255611 [Trichonephila clavipes]|nr:hypothetical protein TNCV_1255611 [Trichonephila clavipes]